VNFGVMPRGDLDPMWAAGLSISVPLWAYRKQNQGVAESQARSEAGTLSAEAVAQVLRLRVAERHTDMQAVTATIQPYLDGLLAQSEATAESTLSQYRVGTLTFASVLEANAGYINDEDGYLAALADAQRIAIAEAEISLDSAGTSLGNVSMGASVVPGVGPIAAGSGSTPSAAGGAGDAQSSSTNMRPGM